MCVGYSQKLKKRPRQSDIRAYNQNNLLKIDFGMSKQEVINKMGGIRSFQTYATNDILLKDQMIANPYSRDLKTDSEGNPFEILWIAREMLSKPGVRTDLTSEQKFQGWDN